MSKRDKSKAFTDADFARAVRKAKNQAAKARGVLKKTQAERDDALEMLARQTETIANLQREGQQILALKRQLAESEAGAAVLREALERLRAQYIVNGAHSFPRPEEMAEVEAALATDAGRKLLEEVERLRLYHESCVIKHQDFGKLEMEWSAARRERDAARSDLATAEGLLREGEEPWVSRDDQADYESRKAAFLNRPRVTPCGGSGEVPYRGRNPWSGDRAPCPSAEQLEHERIRREAANAAFRRASSAVEDSETDCEDPECHCRTQKHQFQAAILAEVKDE